MSLDELTQRDAKIRAVVIEYSRRNITRAEAERALKAYGCDPKKWKPLLDISDVLTTL